MVYIYLECTVYLFHEYFNMDELHQDLHIPDFSNVGYTSGNQV